MELLKALYNINSKSGNEERIKAFVLQQDMRRIAMAKTMADMLNKHFGIGEVDAYDASLKEKKCGY